jgi:hypothetical protein
VHGFHASFLLDIYLLNAKEARKDDKCHNSREDVPVILRKNDDTPKDTQSVNEKLKPTQVYFFQLRKAIQDVLLVLPQQEA